MRRSTIRKALAAKFDDEFRFFRGWMAHPRTTGSIIPTSAITARRMASNIDLGSGLPVLEIGPGTGVITRAILTRGVKPENLYAVEYAPAFVRHLRQNFPGIKVVEGDAFDLDKTLGPEAPPFFDCVISGLPLLNFPVSARVGYLNGLLARLPEGRPVVQFSYGPKSPIPPGFGNYTVKRFDFILRNIPPAQIWVYRRGKSN